MITVDSRAAMILIKAYWSADGWRKEEDRKVSSEDFEYAKQAGVMFDPVVVTHDQLVQRAISILDRLSFGAVVDAFVSSISTRRLYVRSALGSYAVLRHFAAHNLLLSQYSCRVCGFMEFDESDPYDLNIYSLIRLK